MLNVDMLCVLRVEYTILYGISTISIVSNENCEIGIGIMLIGI